MASYRDKLPASGGGQAPSFQRGVYNWATSTATSVTIPITQVNPANSFITQLRGSTYISSGQWDEVTFTGKLNAAGNGIEIVRYGTAATSIVISWEVGTNPAVNVQRGVLFLYSGEADVTIPTIADLTKASAILIGNVQVSVSDTSSTPWASMVRCELTASNLKLKRSASNYPVGVSWEILTYV